MPLNREAVEELREILRREYGQGLSDEEAWDTALNLFNFFNALIHMNSSKSGNAEDNPRLKPHYNIRF
jgi:hypothetical protein